MRNLDFTPLYRSTVGFDHFADIIDRAFTGDVSQPTYPPYNIEKTSDDAYRISIAVAGFSEDDLTLETREGKLLVSARRAEDEADKAKTYLHRGIAERAFEKRFQLADHVSVAGASVVNGMLNIDLVREMPEALKPRRIEIASSKVISAKPKKKAA
ncbi:MAG: molecular chaperone IbpA [Paracoccaceae bacterium]|jgi:molecular chaperone IbpA